MTSTSLASCETPSDVLSEVSESRALVVQVFAFTFFCTLAFHSSPNKQMNRKQKRKSSGSCFSIKVLGDLHAKLPPALMNYLHKFPFNR